MRDKRFVYVIPVGVAVVFLVPSQMAYAGFLTAASAAIRDVSFEAS